MRLLLVEDDPWDLASLVDICTAAGHVVAIARDGADALDQLEAGLMPHAVLTDWRMPKISGLELCRCLRRDDRWRAMPIVMLTALSREEVEGDEPGCANAWVRKPLTVEGVAAALAAACAQGGDTRNGR